MDNLIFSVNVVLPLFLIIVLGYLLTYTKVWDVHFTQTANKICFKFFLPILLFINIYQADIRKLLDMKLIVFALGGVVVTIFAAAPLVMLLIKENNKRGVMIQAIFRSNFILFGIPIASNLFGNKGTGTAAMMIAFVIPFFNFCAVLVLAFFSGEGQKNIQSVLMDVIKNPLIIGSLLGIAASMSGIVLPVTIQKSLSDLGAVGTPLALLVLGGEFELSSLKKNIKCIAFAVLSRLVLVPVIILSAALLLGYRDDILASLLAAFATPVAVNSYIMAQQAGADSELAGQLVIVTTLFAPFSLCFFIYAFKTIGFFG